MKTDYKIEIDEDGELSIIRISDGKLMATVQDGEIKPTAPKFHQFKDEFSELLAEHLGEEPHAANPQASLEKAEPPVAEPVSIQPPANCDKMLGDICPIFIDWLFHKDRAEADKRYAGRNLEAYETLIAADNGR